MNDTQIKLEGNALRLEANPADQRVKARAAAQQYRTEVQQLRANWASLTQAEKTNALRDILMVLARALRVEES